MRPPEHHFSATATSRPSPNVAVAAVARWRDVARRLGPAGPLALVTAVLPIITGAALYGRLGAFAVWLRSGAASAPLLCIAVFATTGGLAIVPTYAMSVLCGWAFGFALGLGATLCSFVGAALIGYAITAAADGGRVMEVVGETPKWRAVHRALSTGNYAKLTAVVAMIRLAPVTPFALANTALAAFRVPMLPYLAGTLLGMAPRAVVVTFFASRMATSGARPTAGPWLFGCALAATAAFVWGMAWVGRRGLARRMAET